MIKNITEYIENVDRHGYINNIYAVGFRNYVKFYSITYFVVYGSIHTIISLYFNNDALTQKWVHVTEFLGG